ncbi:Tim44/TimA family putative adaptor protein [Notoacmeibacter sp. MSK16QG-6]|uniref:Tim44/TimA family putative adaptor protein n=1 Tax=Notoacmeibacter sp. MSK16QG-6 TaxID=2957982 RepID=UPI00209E094C|nr:Tim44/TimA family putative adaptor protein [Notoacmeibacter sp. MSK16QG-6]MCP1199099.1 Tim44/TimA family putative adaptor protein [Notoacmeibacter sp. MSK16QG-6]
MEFVDLSTLFFLVLAVVIAFQLRSVLGRRTGRERPPTDVFRTPDESRDDKVVALPRRDGQPVPEIVEDDTEERLRQADQIAKPDTPANEGLKAIVEADRSFEPRRFMEGARAAHEMIVQAFAQGDRQTLRSLLSPEVMADFDAAVTEREKTGHTIESTYVGLEKADIRSVGMNGREANISIRFVSQMITATYDEARTLVDGDPEQVTEGVDVWTFARNVDSSDPNWLLIATGES